jgi:hypothetical protein
MGGWAGDEHSFSLQCPVDLGVRNFIFFCDRIRQDRHVPTVEKNKESGN